MPLSAFQMVDLYFNGQASDAKFQGNDLLAGRSWADSADSAISAEMMRKRKSLIASRLP